MFLRMVLIVWGGEGKVQAIDEIASIVFVDGWGAEATTPGAPGTPPSASPRVC
jgi:hypothetical protein